MKNEVSNVTKIESPYIHGDWAMVMIPYTKNLTVLSKDGIIYSHKEGSNKCINKFVDDPKRLFFPYKDMPTHYERDGFIGKKKCANVILKCDQPYIAVCNDIVSEYYLVKGYKDAYLCNQILFGKTESRYYNRKQLDELYDTKGDNNKYVIHLDKSTENPADIKELPSEKDLLNDYDDNFSLKFDNAVIVQVMAGEISAKYTDASYIGEDCYYVNETKLPINKYSIEQFKQYAIDIKNSKEPSIPYSLNPDISRSKVANNKKYVRYLKLHKSNN